MNRSAEAGAGFSDVKREAACTLLESGFRVPHRLSRQLGKHGVLTAKGHSRERPLDGAECAKESLREIEKVFRPEGFEAGSSEQTSCFSRR